MYELYVWVYKSNRYYRYNCVFNIHRASPALYGANDRFFYILQITEYYKKHYFHIIYEN